LNASIIHFIKVELKGLVWQALGVRASRKLPKASPISVPSKRIIEDVYRGDSVDHIGVYTRVVMKTLMEFERRYIAKKLVFAVFDLPLGLI